MKPMRILLLMSCGFLVACGESSEPMPLSTVEAVEQSSSSDALATVSTGKQVFFGDLHLHTALSVDAYITNTRTMPDDAYRYAKGEPIEHVSGEKIQLQTPLDFMGVTDHAEMLGVAMAMGDPDDPLSEGELAGDISSSDYARSHGAFQRVIRAAATGEFAELMDPQEALRATRDAWQTIIQAAEDHNQPGQFTTFVAYEWSSMPNLSNLHRNVVFAGTDVPAVPFSSGMSNKPEDLWRHLDEWRSKGSDAFAIPHNANASRGLMYPLVDSEGMAVDVEYADLRMRNEPITEITQFKGTSETHTVLSPLDEFADFELWNTVVGGTMPVDPVPGSYVRAAYQRGLALEADLGTNPFEFGLIGSSDSHDSSTAVEEFNFTGGHGNADATPEIRLNSKASTLTASSLNFSASGLAAVWAGENTRGALFDAIRRKETYATSGTRIRLRFDTSNGEPMGSAVTLDERQLPSFDLWAQQDPNSAPLERMQIIRVTADGEAIFDVACAVGIPDPTTQQCPKSAAGVDTQTCQLVGDGAGELRVSWQDDDYDAQNRTAYYVRVLENPTCRWSTWDAIRIGQAPPENKPQTIQERAWSSPIWVSTQSR
ncbi:MAG: DUF3604 domain-containing protein [Pseudomonadales bacterium]|nr:DUF3604 domain-containing protein [Pseudomonadales bacterium]